MIRFPPPAIFVVLFLIGLALERMVLRIRLVGEGTSPMLGMLGLAFVALGAFLVFWGMLTFRRFRTSILPFRPATAIVQSGPYRFTRNPMYVGMTTAHIGAALAMNVAWPLILLPVAIYLLVRFVIRPEEEYLGRVFGQDYADFKRRVRRWI